MSKQEAAELEAMFGITSERITEIDAMMCAGELPGVQAGPVVMGRPRMYGEHMSTVAFKETDSKIRQIDQRAARLGMKRSEYLRALIDRDLATA